MKEKIITGANDRPKDETIAQTGEGLPDDSGSVIEVDSDGRAEVHEQTVKESKEVNRELDEEFKQGDPDTGPSDTPLGGSPD